MSDDPPSCDVSVAQIWAAAGFEPAEVARRCTHAVLDRLARPVGTAGVEVGFRFTDDAEIAALNATWRGRQGATDVLAFPTAETGSDVPPPGLPLVLGDVVVAFETCAGDAERLGRPLVAHLSHLLVHGLLHLFQYVHDTPEEAAVMEPLEVAILEQLGVPDPYTEPPIMEETR